MNERLIEYALNIRQREQMRQGWLLAHVGLGDFEIQKYDEDLLAMLASSHVAGATLDVCRTEPLPIEHPFWRHPQIRLTPHTSARTLVADTIAQIAHKVAAVERGEPVRGEVDAQRGY
jgi:glyoxylate/hydroxypyruvate reductase A